MKQVLLVTLLALLASAGCDQPPGPQVSSQIPMRIVSSSPAATEICCALGLRDRLVGRSAYCKYPPGIEEVSSIGGLVDVNPEMLIQIEPDLVLISGSSVSQRDHFKRLGLRLETLPDGPLDDVFTSITRVGALVGRETQAEELTQRIRTELDQIDERYPPGEGQRVLLVLGQLDTPPNAPTVIGPGSFIYDLLLRAGYQSAAPGMHAAYAGLALEVVARSDPDIILEINHYETTQPQAQRIAAWKPLGPLQAVQNARVLQISDPKYTIPGPRVAEFYADFRAALAELSRP